MRPHATSADPKRAEDALIRILPLVLIVVMLSIAALLLSSFMSLLEDMNERGEMRRMQQRTTGSLLLIDELPLPSGADARMLTVAGDTHALPRP